MAKLIVRWTSIHKWQLPINITSPHLGADIKDALALLPIDQYANIDADSLSVRIEPDNAETRDFLAGIKAAREVHAEPVEQ